MANQFEQFAVREQADSFEVVDKPLSKEAIQRFESAREQEKKFSSVEKSNSNQKELELEKYMTEFTSGNLDVVNCHALLNEIEQKEADLTKEVFSKTRNEVVRDSLPNPSHHNPDYTPKTPEETELANILADAVVDITPLVGDVKSLVEALRGQTSYSADHLSTLDRIIALGASMPVLGFAGDIKRVTEAASKIREIQKTTEVTELGKEIHHLDQLDNLNPTDLLNTLKNTLDTPIPDVKSFQQHLHLSFDKSWKKGIDLAEQGNPEFLEVHAKSIKKMREWLQEHGASELSEDAVRDVRRYISDTKAYGRNNLPKSEFAKLTQDIASINDIIIKKAK